MTIDSPILPEHHEPAPGPADIDVQPSDRKRSPMRDGWRKFRQSPSGMIGLAILAFFVAVTVVGPALAPHDPGSVSANILQAPSSDHYFGTDNIGKDVFAGTLQGGRVSLIVGTLVALIALTAGIVIGSIAGYFGGIFDSALMRVSEFFQVMPSFILALVSVAIIGPSLGVIIIVISITTWPATARVVRAQFLSMREREFVEAARSIGFSSFYIIRSEILPNAVPPAVVVSTLAVGRAILLEAGLSFLGLGDANQPSWGEMLNRAQPYLSTAWWMSVFPGLAILLVVLGFNLIGDSLNDALNPEDRQR